MKPEPFDTQYANFKGKNIFISRAERGRRGYSCIGCNRPLEAVIPRKNPQHKSFFRHIVEPQSSKAFHCSFDSRKFLEREVENYIIEKGYILLPELVKFPPPGSELPPLLLQEAKELTAATVKAQKNFYLDDKFEIQEEGEDLNKRRWIRPDLTFFDKRGFPILFIEIVITHPIDEQKKAKLIHLGVDTIQIFIPQGALEDLKEIIETGVNTKWVFNHDEFYTDYFSITGENRRELPTVDEQQRIFYQESSTCRRARIRELIWTIEQGLETDSFREIEEGLRGEVGRIGEFSEAAKLRLGKLEAEQERGLYSEFESEERRFAEAESSERAKSRGIEEGRVDLEERYSNEAGKLKEEESTIRGRERDVFGVENPMEQLPRRITSISNDIQRLQKQRNPQEAEDVDISEEERRIDEQLAEFDRIENRIYS